MRSRVNAGGGAGGGMYSSDYGGSFDDDLPIYGASKSRRRGSPVSLTMGLMLVAFVFLGLATFAALSFRSANTKLKGAVKQVTAELEELKMQHGNIVREMTFRQNTVAQLQTRLGSLQRELNDNRIAIQEKERTIRQLEEHKSYNQEGAGTILELSNRVSNCEDQLTQCSTTTAELEEMTNNLEQQVQGLTDKLGRWVAYHNQTYQSWQHTHAQLLESQREVHTVKTELGARLDKALIDLQGCLEAGTRSPYAREFGEDLERIKREEQEIIAQHPDHSQEQPQYEPHSLEDPDFKVERPAFKEHPHHRPFHVPPPLNAQRQPQEAQGAAHHAAAQPHFPQQHAQPVHHPQPPAQHQQHHDLHAPPGIASHHDTDRGADSYEDGGSRDHRLHVEHQ